MKLDQEFAKDPILISLSVRGDDRKLQVNLLELMATSKFFELKCANLEENEAVLESHTFDVKDVPNFNALKQVLQNKSSAVVPTDSTMEDLIRVADYLQIETVLSRLLTLLKFKMPKTDPQHMDRRQVLLYLRLFNILSRNGFMHTTITRPGSPEATQTRTGTMYCCEEHALLKDALTYDITPQFFISYHFKSVMYERELVELSYKSVYTLLLGDYLRISEEDVVRTIKMWINHDYTARIQHYRFLLRCVRFDPEMRLEFILEEVLGYCDSARDYVIAIMALRSGYEKDISKSGPIIGHERIFHGCSE